VKPSKGRKIIGCKWMFKKMSGTTGAEKTRYKTCLVVKGYSQKEGVDFNEIFSHVVRHASIWVLLAMVAYQDLKLEQLDLHTTFLLGELEEDILMSQP